VVRVFDCSRGPTGFLLAIVLISLMPLRVNAQVQRRAAFITLPVSSPTQRVLAGGTCPNQGGILNSVSVPVSKPLELAVVSFQPAPKGGATFELSSADPSIVAAGDPRQSFLPQVTIPEGQTQSNPFFVFGIKVGATTLDAKALTPGFIGFSDPLGAWDVNPGNDPNATKFLDANPQGNTCRAPTSPNLSTDPNVLSTCGMPVQGAVTDKVTKLLMRMVSGLPGTACYKITSTGPPDQGTVSTDVTGTQSVGSNNDAFSFYTAPDGFGAMSDSRMVQVQFTFTPNIGNGDTTKFTVPLTLVRPPVMLIHGIWSNREAWSGDFWNRKPLSSYFTFAPDYGPTHDSSFTTNQTMVKDFVSNTIQMARAGGYAATQADVVAHSMGGILTRLYAASKDFMRDDNYQKGDVHRFITLDTPHGGTSFANLLVALHKTKPTQIEASVHNLVGADAQVVNGAVCDLNENSPGLQALMPTSIDSQIITATGGPIGSFWNGVGSFHLHSFEKELTKTECIKRNIFFVCVQEQPVYDQNVLKVFRFSRANDAIVPLCSQQGGVLGTTCPGGGTAGFNFGNLIHFGADKFGFSLVGGINNTAAVATRAFALLDGPPGALATSIPGVASNGSGSPVTVSGQGPLIDRANFNNQCLAGAPPPMKRNVIRVAPNEIAEVSNLATTPAAAGDPRVTITTPANGQLFAPGDTVSVTVAIQSPLKANDVSLNVAGLGSEPGTNYDGSTYQVSFAIPDTFAGPLQLSPAITDTSNNPITGVTTTIAVRPTTAPLSLTLPQANYILNKVGATERISVVGNYAGSMQRDLTSSASGTVYKSSNAKVISVDAEGNVKAIGLGTAVVTVTNFGVQAFATFTVEDPAHPLPPQNVTSQVNAIRSGLRVDRNTGFFVQTTQWTAPSIPVVGPLYVVVTGLPAGVTLVNAGATQNIAPLGSPYLKFTLPDGTVLQPGTNFALMLQFLNPGRVRIDYSANIFRTLATP
jgi:triacylglycerol esterase/lipase EstA (alpha/beta hydrolase family)